jgi:hypothetical protein
VVTLLVVGVAPLFGFFYKATLNIYPGLFLTISCAGYGIVLILTFVTHNGIASSRKQASKSKEVDKGEAEEETLMSVKNVKS